MDLEILKATMFASKSSLKATMLKSDDVTTEDESFLGKCHPEDYPKEETATGNECCMIWKLR